MKNLLFILFVALSVSVAQAASVSWSGTGSMTLTDVDYSKPVTLTYTITTDAIVPTEVQFLSMVLGSGTTVLGTAGGELFDAVSVSFGGYRFTYSDMNGQTNTASYVLDFVNLTCTVEGLLAGTYDLSEFLTAPTDSTLAASTSLESDSLTALSVTITYTSTSEVPEPTILAFLALGVAGLALRRRAA